MGQVIATDPFHPNHATIGGDSWGVYVTDDAANHWRAATKYLTPAEVSKDNFFFTGLAYSRKHPGLVYGVTGKDAAAGQGGLLGITGDMARVISREVGTGDSWPRQDRPRPTGHRVVVDFDSTTGLEYLYVGTGNGGGVKRSTNDGQSWKVIGLSGLSAAITGMTRDPVDPTVLYVSTTGGAFRIDDARGSGQATALSSAPARVEDVQAVAGQVFAAANVSGVYRLTNKGQTWTQLGSTFFPTTSEWESVGGSGTTVYVGCADPVAGKSIARSTDGGNSWSWVSSPANVSIVPWGTSQSWWLAQYGSRVVMGNNTFEAAEIAVDAFNPAIVYVAGRSGAWKSEDSGDTWRPAVNGLGGTMHTAVLAGMGGSAVTDDVDWAFETTVDHYATCAQSGTGAPGAGGRTDVTVNGHRYQVTATVPRDVLLDGVSVSDEFFRASAVRVSDLDVSVDGNFIYVGQYGGGVLVGHPVGVAWP